MTNLNPVFRVPLDDTRAFLSISEDGWMKHCMQTAALDVIAYVTERRFVILKRIPLGTAYTRAGSGSFADEFGYLNYIHWSHIMFFS